MKFTLAWLKEHLDTQASLEEIVDRLTMIGLEVERVEDKAKELGAFIVARVISAEQHPNADRLRVCTVDFGGGSTTVVCGAPNARTGMKGVFSPVGTYIPGKKLTLAKGVIRGVESNGMLCSEAELELSDNHDGIIDDKANRQGQGHQRKIVETESQQVHDCEREHDRRRQRQGRNDRGTEVSQKQEDNQYNQGNREQQ